MPIVAQVITADAFGVRDEPEIKLAIRVGGSEGRPDTIFVVRRA